MKLIATLATLAALVGQTEAATSALIVKSVKVGSKPCTDVVAFEAEIDEAVAATKKLHFSSTKLSTKKTESTDLQELSATATLCNDASALAILTTVAAAEASGTTTWSWTVATGQTCAAATDNSKTLVTLKNVCNNGVSDYSGTTIGLKATNDDETPAFPSAEAADAGPGPTLLASFDVTKLPVTKATEGEFEATFTGVTTLNGKKLILNLPEGYTIPVGAKCSIKTATADAFVVTGASGAGLTTACTNTCIFSQAIPASGTGAVDTSKLTFACDKVKSGDTVAAPADGDVAIKAHATGSPEDNDHVAYSKSKSASPTKSPTAKPDDSPASVATASGVVVGALGVAALFLA